VTACAPSSFRRAEETLRQILASSEMERPVARPSEANGAVRNKHPGCARAWPYIADGAGSLVRGSWHVYRSAPKGRLAVWTQPKFGLYALESFFVLALLVTASAWEPDNACRQTRLRHQRPDTGRCTCASQTASRTQSPPNTPSTLRTQFSTLPFSRISTPARPARVSSHHASVSLRFFAFRSSGRAGERLLVRFRLSSCDTRIS
jgi:hypothetical protein